MTENDHTESTDAIIVRHRLQGIGFPFGEYDFLFIAAKAGGAEPLGLAECDAISAKVFAASKDKSIPRPVLIFLSTGRILFVWPCPIKLTEEAKRLRKVFLMKRVLEIAAGQMRDAIEAEESWRSMTT